MKTSPKTIGFLPGWPAYDGVRMDPFLKSIIAGVRKAAFMNGCNLMIACGVNQIPGTRSLRTAWPIQSPDCDFVPVGHWNTDGLIILAPLRSEERGGYIRRLMEDGFPVIYIGSGEDGPSIQIDNESGIRQSVEHLVKHGHRRIAFLAGDPLDLGDSAARLRAYRAALEEFEAEFDPRLVANGLHNQEYGRKAMEQILASGSAFTAVVASNDSSAFGALQILQAVGRRVPTDVALVSFDDQPLAACQIPPLTSVHYPREEISRQAVESLLDLIRDPGKQLPEKTRLPVQLVIRQSCGCSHPYSLPSTRIELPQSAPVSGKEGISGAMLEALHADTGRLPTDAVEERCRQLVQVFTNSVAVGDAQNFHQILQEALALNEAAEDQIFAWQQAISILRAKTLPQFAGPQRVFAEDLLHQARLMISDAADRQNLRTQLQSGEINNRISWMAACMVHAGREREILGILAENLPALGIRSGQAVFFEPRKDDPFGGLRFYADSIPGSTRDAGNESRALCCDTRDYPPPEIRNRDEPFALALLPLVFQDEPMGFVAFDSADLEHLSSIVREMAAALKSASMHSQVSDLSLSDALTGVQNQRFFTHFLRREVECCRRYGRSMALMMMDLDGFAEYNHAHGLAKGDDALRVVARCVSAAARRGSDIICRYEGDAFVIILPETGLDGALTVAETIRAKIRRCNGLSGHLSISIGVAVADTDSYESDFLLNCASRAMYHAKTAGRNQTVAIPISSLAA